MEEWLVMAAADGVDQNVEFAFGQLGDLFNERLD